MIKTNYNMTNKTPELILQSHHDMITFTTAKKTNENVRPETEMKK